ncbi:hypothetical protein I7I50_04176 [Histoplasma capsulatum G186AR]|uniref:Uncharacterized protein n=1 Tax=Ajellomyces capsulatus TaxID=5037 RepID=A0A8H7YQ99_AJECA|nr:hypothetical protein I7I52_05084 [Histoplasma capsulatum]QSS75136.1 hypothetical protein I7I50_04176 [Histoplasma capsulatum G186AR]
MHESMIQWNGAQLTYFKPICCHMRIPTLIEPRRSGNISVGHIPSILICIWPVSTSMNQS